MSGMVSGLSGTLGWGDQPADDVSIIVGGKQVFGWETVTIQLGLDVMPWTFELTTTEWDPTSQTDMTMNEGDACQVMIGSDLVITGYVVTINRSADTSNHLVHVVGASKSLDLTETSAKFSSYQINKSTALSLARILTEQYQIGVQTQGTISSNIIDQFDVILTESSYEILDRICRFAGCLFYDTPDGDIVLSSVGSKLAASGFLMPGNVESASSTRSTAGRYSEISAVRQTTDVLFSTPDQHDLGGQMALITDVGPLHDPGIKRYRPLIIPSEMGDAGATVTKARVQWEINRRYGRGYKVELTCDSWRDAAGRLWAVNTLAPISMPALKCTPTERWVIGDVVFRKDGEGTHAHITLLPPQAYEIEPVLLQGLDLVTAQALREATLVAPVQSK